MQYWCSLTVTIFDLGAWDLGQMKLTVLQKLMTVLMKLDTQVTEPDSATELELLQSLHLPKLVGGISQLDPAGKK